jgi:hypothetical protein
MILYMYNQNRIIDIEGPLRTKLYDKTMFPLSDPS